MSTHQITNPCVDPEAQPLTRDLLLQLTEEIAAQGPSIRRETPREQLYCEHVDIQLFYGDAKPFVATASTRDISVSGMGITCRQELEADEVVELSFYVYDTHYTARARVVHCSATVGAYKIGLQFLF